jgi:hypothetical protein
VIRRTAAPISFRWVNTNCPSDEQSLIEVTSKCVIDSERVIAFDRAPNFFTWPRAVFSEFRYVGAFAGDEMIGYLLVSTHKAWLEKRESQSAYVGDARVLPEWRRRRVLRGALAFVERELDATVQSATFVVRKGNAAMASVAARFARGWPMARLGDITVHDMPAASAFPTPRSSLELGNATAADAEAIAELLTMQARHHFIAERPSTRDVLRTMTDFASRSDGAFIVARDRLGLAAVACLRSASPGRKVRFLDSSPSTSPSKCFTALFRALRPMPIRHAQAAGMGCISRFAYRDNAKAAGDVLLAHTLSVARSYGYERVRMIDDGTLANFASTTPNRERRTTLSAFGVFRDAQVARASQGARVHIDAMSL